MIVLKSKCNLKLTGFSSLTWYKLFVHLSVCYETKYIQLKPEIYIFFIKQHMFFILTSCTSIDHKFVHIGVTENKFT